MSSTPTSNSVPNRKLIIHSLLTTKDPNFQCKTLVGTRHLYNQKLIDNFNTIYHSGRIIDGYVQCRKCSSILVKRKRDNANLKKHQKLHDKENADSGSTVEITTSTQKKMKKSKPSKTTSSPPNGSADAEDDSTTDVWYDAVC